MVTLKRYLRLGAASSLALLAACTSPRPDIEPFRLSGCVTLTDSVRQGRLVNRARYANLDPARFDTHFLECPDTYEIRTVPRAGGATIVHEIDKATARVRIFERQAD